MRTKHRVTVTKSNMTDDEYLLKRQITNKSRRKTKRNLKKVKGITLPGKSSIVDGELKIEKDVRKDFHHNDVRRFQDVGSRKYLSKNNDKY